MTEREELEALREEVKTLKAELQESREQLSRLAHFIVQGGLLSGALMTPSASLTERVRMLEEDRAILLGALTGMASRYQSPEPRPEPEPVGGLGETVTDNDETFRLAAEQAVKRIEEQKKRGG